MEIFFLVLLAFIPVIFLATIIYIVAEKYSISTISVCVSFFFIFVGLWIFSFISYRKDNNPTNIYEQKIRDIQKAERELQKFLIDHPEFKEVE